MYLAKGGLNSICAGPFGATREKSNTADGNWVEVPRKAISIQGSACGSLSIGSSNKAANGLVMHCANSRGNSTRIVRPLLSNRLARVAPDNRNSRRYLIVIMGGRGTRFEIVAWYFMNVGLWWYKWIWGVMTEGLLSSLDTSLSFNLLIH